MWIFYLFLIIIFIHFIGVFISFKLEKLYSRDVVSHVSVAKLCLLYLVSLVVLAVLIHRFLVVVDGLNYLNFYILLGLTYPSLVMTSHGNY